MSEKEQEELLRLFFKYMRFEEGYYNNQADWGYDTFYFAIDKHWSNPEDYEKIEKWYRGQIEELNRAKDYDIKANR